MMLGDKWGQTSPPGLKCRERALLVGLHQPAVAGHTGGKDGAKPALGAFLGHVLPLRLGLAISQIVVVLTLDVYRDGIPVMGWSGRAPAPVGT